MSIRFACPSCARVYRVDETLVGQRAKCSACQQRMLIPDPAVARAAASAKVPLAPPPNRTLTTRRPASPPLVRIATVDARPVQVVTAAQLAIDEDDLPARPLPSAALHHADDEPLWYELISQ